MRSHLKAAALVALLGSACVEQEQVGEGMRGAGASGAASVYHSRWNGGASSVSEGTELSSFVLEVWESSTSQTRDVGLWYSRSEVDPTSYLCETVQLPCKRRRDDPTPCDPVETEICRYTRSTWEYGYGSIPARDYRVTSNGATLNTVVSPGATFYIERCSADESTWTWTCSNQGGGAIDLDWSRNKIGSEFSSGTGSARFGKYSYQQVGTSRQATADASGSFLGATVASSNGFLSTGVSVSKEMYVAPRP
jgi:hypothetical protein